MASWVEFVAFVVSVNVMEVKFLYTVVIIFIRSLCIEYFLGLKLLPGSLMLIVKDLSLLCIEELLHVELFTYPIVVSFIVTLHVFFGVNLYYELNGSAVIQHVVLDQDSAVIFLTFYQQDLLVLFQVMEVLSWLFFDTE